MTEGPVVVSFGFQSLYYFTLVVCKTFDHTFPENAILGLTYLTWFPSTDPRDRFMSKQLNPTPNCIHNLVRTYSSLISKVEILLMRKKQIYLLFKSAVQHEACKYIINRLLIILNFLVLGGPSGKTK